MVLPLWGNGVFKQAVTLYTVPNPQEGSKDFEIPSCSECWKREMGNGINIVSLTPVVQPRHLNLLNTLLKSA